MAVDTNDIRRHITGGRTAAQLARDPAQLILAEAGGILWASNRFWATPAPRVAALLTKFNLAAEPGCFEVDGSVRRTDRSPLISMPGLLDLAAYPEPAFPVLLGGKPAHVPVIDGKTWLAVYQTPGGALMGLRADTLPWLASVAGYSGYGQSGTELFGLGSHECFSEVRVMTKGRGNEPVLLAADVIRTVTPGKHGTDPDTQELTWTAPVTENLGLRVVGALMAQKLEG